MRKRSISIFLLAIILFTSSGQLMASEIEKEREIGEVRTRRSETIPISGGSLTSQDEAFRVEIDKGIYYRPVFLSIETLSRRPLKEKYIAVSKLYKLSMDNPLETLIENKKIEISFEYYGKEDAGIYMLEDGDWTYLQSTIEDGRIKAYINPATISKRGNIFTLLVDTRAQTFYDIRGHWAKDEIETYTRRGVIRGYPDKTFKPDLAITRAEFLLLLSRQDKWKLNNDVSNNRVFKDVDRFNPYNEREISYSYSHNYIRGYPDGYFRPYNYISYKEVDIIMGRVLNDPNFSWRTYANKMIYDKRVRSSSYDSYNKNITRAEFSYMLYKLNEWKY